MNLSQVFAGQNVGVTQAGERIWLVTFMHYDLGYLLEPDRDLASANRWAPTRGLNACREPRRLTRPIVRRADSSVRDNRSRTHIGRLYRRSPVPGTRRVLLKATRYHVYCISSEPVLELEELLCI